MTYITQVSPHYSRGVWNLDPNLDHIWIQVASKFCPTLSIIQNSIKSFPRTERIETVWRNVTVTPNCAHSAHWWTERCHMSHGITSILWVRSVLHHWLPSPRAKLRQAMWFASVVSPHSIFSSMIIIDNWVWLLVLIIFLWGKLQYRQSHRQWYV